ncbi:MAG TPA: hypothetical protein GX699_03945 [Firmicutes bacterium]|nr:hypothetical protein [Bacillota bacterium]
MKKCFFLLFCCLFLLAGCSSGQEGVFPEGKREPLNVCLDGEPVVAGGFTYEKLKPLLSTREINGTEYACFSLADLIRQEKLPAVEGAFLEAVDGFVSYSGAVDKLYLAPFTVADGEYLSVSLDGLEVYAAVEEGGKVNKGVVNVFLVTTPADFTVEIQRNGEKIGTLSLAEFLQKTDVNGEKKATAMFDGSFLYDGGASTYTGRFLGISYDTLLAKLQGLKMDLSGTITEVEYYGTNGLGKEGKNLEYSLNPEDEKYYGALDFFCMFDGRTRNDITSGAPIGLTAFVNGSGGRWMTNNLQVINFIIQ